MKVLLDECVPRKFKASLTGRDCRTVPEAGFAGKKNGELLSLAEANGFQIFLTVDRGIRYRQNLAGRQISTMVLRAKSNQLIDLLPLANACLDRIPLAGGSGLFPNQCGCPTSLPLGCGMATKYEVTVTSSAYDPSMDLTTVEEIEHAIAALAPEQREELCTWLDEHYLHSGDVQLKRAVDAGRFDDLISRAIADHKAGRTEAL